MAKYGRLMEFTAATGHRHVVRTKRPTFKACGDYTRMIETGWVLCAWTDGGGGASWMPREQLRDIGNDR